MGNAMKSRTYEAHGLAGCVQIKRARQTGTLIEVFHADQAQLRDDPDNPRTRWVCSCAVHGVLIYHRTLALARSHAARPKDWCEGCRKGRPAAVMHFSEGTGPDGTDEFFLYPPQAEPTSDVVSAWWAADLDHPKLAGPFAIGVKASWVAYKLNHYGPHPPSIVGDVA